MKRLHHIDYRYHFVRERVNSGDIVLEYIATRDQLADIFTKALEPAKFIPLRDKIVVRKSLLKFV